MIKVTVLLENTKSTKAFKSKHGLSILINNGINTLLLDVGPNDYFAKNAKNLSINLKDVNFVILSHSHIDHTGGLNVFCDINKAAPIYLFDEPNSKYYMNIFWKLYVSVSLRCSEDTKERITTIIDNKQIDDKTWFLHNKKEDYKKPKFNKSLYMKIGNKMVPDTFEHEGILAIKDKDELVVLNSCSHNGVINSIETVKSIFPNKRIRSYLGGFHFNNPITGQHENDDTLNKFSDYIKSENINVYTGHCTGNYCIEYLENRLGLLMHRIQTGNELEI